MHLLTVFIGSKADRSEKETKTKNKQRKWERKNHTGNKETGKNHTKSLKYPNWLFFFGEVLVFSFIHSFIYFYQMTILLRNKKRSKSLDVLQQWIMHRLNFSPVSIWAMFRWGKTNILKIGINFNRTNCDRSWNWINISLSFLLVDYLNSLYCLFFFRCNFCQNHLIFLAIKQRNIIMEWPTHTQDRKKISIT